MGSTLPGALPSEPEEEVAHDTKSFDYGKYVLVRDTTVFNFLENEDFLLSILFHLSVWFRPSVCVCQRAVGRFMCCFVHFSSIVSFLFLPIKKFYDV